MATKHASNGALVQNLNDDLAAEYQAVVMYTTYAAQVSGVHRRDLKEFFEAEVPDEQGHAQALADKIVSLGGKPTTKPAEVPSAKTNHERLENALAAEEDTLKRYTKRRGEAESAGELGLQLTLEEMILDETKHRDELRLMLEKDGKE